MSERSRERSVFLAALGGDADRLHPAVRRYAAGPPEPGLVGVGTGEFEVAGSRFGKLNLLLRPVVGPRLLMTEHGRDVPFTVVNRPVLGGSLPELRAERTFRFASGAQSFVDSLEPGDEPGVLLNRLGSAARVELELRCWANEAGHLRLSSRRTWMRLGPIRLRLPAPLSVRVEVEDGFDATSGRQTVDATVRNPLAGTVLEYRGSFTYRYEAR